MATNKSNTKKVALTTEQKPATKKAAKPKAEAQAKPPRKASKAEMILNLLRRPTGATSAELMKATGWQAHSVRGYLSGTIGKTMGLELKSAKNDVGERIYSL